MKTKSENNVSFETFTKIGTFDIGRLRKNEPSCFNGAVSFRKYKVTIEEVDEPVEVLAERLQQLWDNCDNFHHWKPLRDAAKSIGYDLIGDAGNKNRK